MAVRYQTQDNITFGTAAATVRITHARFTKNSVSVTRELPSAVTVTAGQPMRVLAGDWDIVYLAGDLSNDHIAQGWDPFWLNQTISLDLLTDATTVVSDTGYRAQTYSRWVKSTEND